MRIRHEGTPGEPLDGIVLDVSAEWILLARLRDGAYLDGYSAIRTADISAVRPDDRFLPFLKAQRNWPPARPTHPIDLGSAQGVVRGALDNAPVLGFYRSTAPSGGFWIAHGIAVVEPHWWYLTISPEGTWDEGDERARIDEVSRVDFLTDYLSVLQKSAGSPPEDSVMVPRPTGAAR